MTSAVTSSNGANPFDFLNGGNAAATTNSAEEMADTFLKLLVTQMQNQDPLNPMDNAQVTSQMAQINTVSGIQQLNTTMNGMLGQFAQMQALQGASLVGRNVLVEGSSLALDAEGVARAGFELDGPADRVKVEILSPAGRVIDTLDFGAQGSGRHGFEWEAGDLGGDAGDLRFRVVATRGGSSVSHTPLVIDHVLAVANGGSGIDLELASGRTLPYNQVRAIS